MRHSNSDIKLQVFFRDPKYRFIIKQADCDQVPGLLAKLISPYTFGLSDQMFMANINYRLFQNFGMQIINCMQYQSFAKLYCILIF